jgi:Acetyltransferase (GNAT) domain
MPVYTFDPLHDPRWGEFLARNSRASVFHTTAWLQALRKTYGYEPVVYTNTPPGRDLADGIVLCRVESWVTGRRLVSLPFSDHCEPLLNGNGSSEALFEALQEDTRKQRWRYVELRSFDEVNGAAGKFDELETYCFHELDLAPSIDSLFRGFHKSSVQRKIKRANREGLIYREGRSKTFLDQFYRLLLTTRRRHQIPPQPLAWYRNLLDCFGNDLKIRVAYKDELPIASILTLQFKNKLVFKYGCSDSAWHHLGGVQLLLWRAIEDAKGLGLHTFDLGRSKIANTGLITFKEHWGPTRSELNYWKYWAPGTKPGLGETSQTSWPMQFAKHIFARAPSKLLSAAGNLFYRHIG